MRICCAVPVLVSVVTAAVLLALVPAAAGIDHYGSGTHNYRPLPREPAKTFGPMTQRR
jgi:hypothetical protein